MKHYINDMIDLEALSKGSIAAFDSLFIAYYPRVKNFIFSLTNDMMVSEDLAQDTFVHLWTSRILLGNVENLNAYIYRTAKHVLFDYLDRKKNISTVGLEDAFTAPTIDEVEDIVFGHELEELITKAVEAMPEQRQRVFQMSRYQGLSHEEIAGKLGISKRTVEAHLSMALATLRKIAISLKSILF